MSFVGVGRYLLFFGVVVWYNSANAQSSATAVVNQPIVWFSYFGNFKVSKHLSIYTDTHIRFVDDFQSMQNQYRIGLEYLASKKFSFIPLGYVYTRNFLYGKQPMTYENNERRFFQQALYRHSAGKFRFYQRIRFEERFIQVHSKNSSGEIVDEGFDNNYQFRIRYRFNVSYPLGAPEIEPGGIFLTAFDEMFISWGEKVTINYPDQNRLFLGLGYQISKEISVQGGYFYQILVKSNGLQQENNMGVLLQFYFNFDFSKHD